ncbi:hypothetical protein E4T50_03986 [Aureobasidium sp. EXF-12298]|nr:hypothetical protein E4T50_03986 [Aureobasidium sp. EXF-12298]
MPPSAVRRTSSSDSTDSIRKRVGKACDRCRLKKSKCDGSHPCTRCKADNAICVFGERKKSHDKIYPKGYVEMLEQQQAQLVAGLQETYRRLVDANVWPGKPLSEASGQPLTHDILARLDLLEPKNDGSGEHEHFEEDCQKLQQRLISEGASFIARRSSISSESDHGLPRKHARTSSHSSVHSTPIPTSTAPIFDDKFTFHQSASPTPVSHSPVPKFSQMRSPIKPSPLHNEAINNDDFLMPSWSDQFSMHGLSAADIMRSQSAMQAPMMQDGFQAAIAYGNAFDPQPEYDNMIPFGSPTYATPAQGFGAFTAPDWMNEPMEVDFSKFVQVST